jgi:hypothetical protein
MTTEFNEKGKYFTEVIPKANVPVIIQTLVSRIEGCFHARYDNRLKDELNSEIDEQFMAITDAVIYDLDGNELYRSNFLALNRDSIVWLIPQRTEDGETSAGGEE